MIKIDRDGNAYYGTKLIGYVNMLEDGYYYIRFRKKTAGYLTPYMLRAIADKLDELNKQWDDFVQKNLNND